METQTQWYYSTLIQYTEYKKSVTQFIIMTYHTARRDFWGPVVSEGEKQLGAYESPSHEYVALTLTHVTK
jgi:hypothetical protein